MCKSLSEAKSSVTATEFLDRLQMMEDEWNEHTKLDHYLARIAFEIHQLNFILGGRPTLKPEDFLLKFGPAAAGPPELTEAERERNLQASKAKWLGLVGLGKDGKPKAAEDPRPKPVPKVVPLPAGRRR